MRLRKMLEPNTTITMSMVIPIELNPTVKRAPAKACMVPPIKSIEFPMAYNREAVPHTDPEMMLDSLASVQKKKAMPKQQKNKPPKTRNVREIQNEVPIPIKKSPKRSVPR